MISVIYTGGFPNACLGHLKVFRNGVLIYKTANYSFMSTGHVKFDLNWKITIEAGRLVWKDMKEKEKFITWAMRQPEDEEIIENAQQAIDTVVVCCGGCKGV